MIMKIYPRRSDVSYHKLSPHQSIRSLFLNNINVNHISESLKIVNSTDTTEKAQSMMDGHDYDCLGVKEKGKVIGYIEKQDLDEGICKQYVRSFSTAELVSDSTSLLQTLYLFKNTKRIFVLEANQVTKLVTHADLQKAPVQLLLFGLISLVEMYLLELIKRQLPKNSWIMYLNNNRLEATKILFTKRKEMNEEIELIDCLQLCDKRDIVTSDRQLFNLLQFESKNRGREYFRRLEQLRNNLAHAQDFIGKFTTCEIISLVEQTEDVLQRCEAELEEI